MKSVVLLLTFAAVAFGKNLDVVRVVEPVDIPQLADTPEQVSMLGYLKNVAIPAAEARRKAEEKYVTQSRIVGGEAAELAQIPWQAGLITDIIGLVGNGVCGGALVSPTRVLTAAHCWFDGVNQAWRITVVLGSVLLFGTDGVRDVTGVVAVHPNWFPLLARNDIAVIYLSHPVATSRTIAPVSLPSAALQDEKFVGEIATASGFGLTSDDSAGITLNQFLSFVQLQVITNNACFLSFPINLHESNICTSGSGGRGTCRGDSGGPLVVTRNNKPILIGITSFGSPRGCESGRPAAYARITYFLDFLREHL